MTRTPYSRRRHMPELDHGRGPNGRRLCRWCRTEVVPPQRTFCGKAECLHEYKIRRQPAYARRQVRKRDQGVCQLCGVDTDQIQRQHRDELAGLCPACPLRAFACSHLPDCPKQLTYLRHRQEGYVDARGHYWEMDHIIPVVKGGGGCGLDNLRTLCIRCHKDQTAQLAKSRSKRQRQTRLAV